MSTLTPVEVMAEPTVSEQFSEARVYLACARTMAHGAAAYMVLAGYELKRLKKLQPETRGRPGKTRTRADYLAWGDLVQRELSISADTAARYMALADAAKTHVPALAGVAKQLLETPLGAISQIEQQALLEKVTRALPQESARQLMFDWGILRQPKALGGARTPAERDAAEILTAEKLAAEAREALAAWLAEGRRVLLGDNLCAHLPHEHVRIVHRELTEIVKSWHRGVRHIVAGGAR